MFSKIAKLPDPLKAVIWLNIIIGSLELIIGIALLNSSTSEALTDLGAAVACFIVIVGILKRSKFIRILVLILAWMGVTLYTFSTVIGLFTLGISAIAVMIPLGTNIITVWGLMASSSQQYFRIGQPVPPVLQSTPRDWMGNVINPRKTKQGGGESEGRSTNNGQSH